MANQPTLGISAQEAIVDPYLDSSVFLAAIKRETLLAHDGLSRVQVATAILEGARNRQFKLYTSFWTMVEVRRKNSKTEEPEVGELQEVYSLFNEFMEHGWIEPIELNREIAEKAQALGGLYGVGTGDCVHLASALLSGAKVLFAWD